MKKSRKRIKRLTPERKKAVWEKPKTNAGAGWQSFRDATNPLIIDHDPWEKT